MVKELRVTNSSSLTYKVSAMRIKLYTRKKRITGPLSYLVHVTKTKLFTTPCPSLYSYLHSVVSMVDQLIHRRSVRYIWKVSTLYSLGNMFGPFAYLSLKLDENDTRETDVRLSVIG